MLCKCSGKYIDIYFNLKITFFFFSLPTTLLYAKFEKVGIKNANLATLKGLQVYLSSIKSKVVTIFFFFFFLRFPPPPTAKILYFYYFIFFFLPKFFIFILYLFIFIFFPAENWLVAEKDNRTLMQWLICGYHI